MGGRLGDLPDQLASLPSLGDDAAEFAADIDRARQELGDRAREEPGEPAAPGPTPSSRAASPERAHDIEDRDQLPVSFR